MRLKIVELTLAQTKAQQINFEFSDQVQTQHLLHWLTQSFKNSGSVSVQSFKPQFISLVFALSHPSHFNFFFLYVQEGLKPSKAKQSNTHLLRAANDVKK